MENVDNWEVVTDEQMGAYLSDKRDSINISGFDDGIDARYSYETEVEKKIIVITSEKSNTIIKILNATHYQHFLVTHGTACLICRKA